MSVTDFKTFHTALKMATCSDLMCWEQSVKHIEYHVSYFNEVDEIMNKNLKNLLQEKENRREAKKKQPKVKMMKMKAM